MSERGPRYEPPANQPIIPPAPWEREHYETELDQLGRPQDPFYEEPLPVNPPVEPGKKI